MNKDENNFKSDLSFEEQRKLKALQEPKNRKRFIKLITIGVLAIMGSNFLPLSSLEKDIASILIAVVFFTYLIRLFKSL